MVRMPACIADAYRWCTPTRSATLSGRLPVHVFENAGGGTCNEHFGIPRGMTAIGTKLKEAGCERLHRTVRLSACQSCGLTARLLMDHRQHAPVRQMG